MRNKGLTSRFGQHPAAVLTKPGRRKPENRCGRAAKRTGHNDFKGPKNARRTKWAPPGLLACRWWNHAIRVRRTGFQPAKRRTAHGTAGGESRAASRCRGQWRESGTLGNGIISGCGSDMADRDFFQVAAFAPCSVAPDQAPILIWRIPRKSAVRAAGFPYAPKS